MKTKLFLTGLALVIATTLASAQDTIPRGQRLLNGTGRGPAYVDANNNNICDNFEKGVPQGPRSQNIVNNRGRGRGNCFVQNGRGQGFGRGQGAGRGQGFGRGRNYVDENKNGICDYFESPVKM